MSQSNKCNPNETAACCCVDVGTIIDNDDCTAAYENIFASEADAVAKMEALTASARSVQSDPCDITHVIEKEADGFKLSAKFVFCCGAESLIFQLKLR